MSCTITEHEVQVVVTPDDCNAEPVVVTAVDGTSVHYEPEPTEIHINAGPRGLPGTDVDLQKTATHIQWRPHKDGEAWRDLVALSDLVGPKSFKAGDIIFSMDNPGTDWVACDGTTYTGGGPLTALLPGGVLPDFTGSQVPAYICKTATVATNAFILDTDPRLADAREWTAATVDQAEAEAGTATTRRAWTAQRVRQAMLGWWGGFAAKTTPVDADSIVIADSAASNAPKRLSWANAVAKLRGTFVEGPASAVDGQILVFDGATGKKAKALAKTDPKFSELYPSFNMLKDSGGFYGYLSNGFPNISAFSSGAGPLTATNGASWSDGGTFLYYETPRQELFSDFSSKISLNSGMWKVGKLTAGSGITGKFTHSDLNDYAPATTLNVWPLYPINGSQSKRLTFAVWVRAVDADAIFWWRSGDAAIVNRDGIAVNKADKHIITPADKWVHFCIRTAAFYATNSFSPFNLQQGKSMLFAMPILIAADTDIAPHNTQCAAYLPV